MKKFDVVIALEGLREAREKWGKARGEFFSGYEAVLSRLLNEAAVNFMSAQEVGEALGVSTSTVRTAMRKRGLDPRSGRALLSKQAAEALAENSALMGIEPHEMDLMSPLAYLPMGEQMKRELQDKTVSKVTEFDAEDHEDLAHYRELAERYHDMLVRLGFCTKCGDSMPCTTCGAGL